MSGDAALREGSERGPGERDAAPVRLLFVPGPGDVEGTWRQWRQGGGESRIPAIAYSQQVYDLAAQLGAELDVVPRQGAGSAALAPPGALAPGLAPGRIEVRFLDLPFPRGRGLGFHLGEIGYGLGLARRILAGRYDAVIFQCTLSHYWPLRPVQWAGVPTLLSLHNTPWPLQRGPGRKDRILGRLNRGFLRACVRVLGVSDAVGAQIRRLCGPDRPEFRRIVAQYRAEYRDLWRPRAQGLAPRRFLYLGRIETNKGVFTLLAAFERLAARVPEARLCFVGEGSARAELRAAAAASPAAAGVEVAGPTDGAGVFAALAAADMLVCPTTARFSEGLAKTPIEAALCGVPSIVTPPAAAVAELLGAAVRVVPDDGVAALAEALTDLADDSAAYAAMAAATKTARLAVFDRARGLEAALAEALAEALPAKVGARLRAGNEAGLEAGPALDARAAGE